MAFVTLSNFEESRLSFEDIKSEKSSRVSARYNYKDRGIKELWLVLDKNSPPILSKGVFEDKFKGERTGKYTTTLILDGETPQHRRMYEILDHVYKEISAYEEKKGKNNDKPVVYFPVDVKEDSDKCFIYSKIIGSNERIYTKAFDNADKEIADVKKIGKSMVRPVISISYPIVNPKKINVRISLVQMVVEEYVSVNIQSKLGRE